MKTFKITIWKFNEALYSGNFQFETDGEARNYALGLFEGIRVMGGEPTGYETEVIDGEEVGNPMCKKYQDAESIPNENDKCSLCEDDCCDF
jgi:hypothetical protein